jgi:diguanylate cyclase (GGDEF)-like protein
MAEHEVREIEISQTAGRVEPLPVLSTKDAETVEVRLIQTLFGNMPSIVLGSLIGLLAASFVAWNYWNPLTAVICSGMVMTSIWRCLVHLGYEKDVHREMNARAWESRFSWAAWSFSACIGATGVAGLVGSANTHVHLFLIVTIVGLVSTMASRNAGRIKIVGPQVALIMVPIGIAFAYANEWAYWALAAVSAFHLVSLVGLARTWGDRFRDSFANEIASRRLADIVEVKNQLFNTALDNMKRGFAIVGADGKFVEANNRIFELVGLDRSQLPEHCGIVDIVEKALDRGTIDAKAAVTVRDTFELDSRTDRMVTIAAVSGTMLEFHREPDADGRAIFSVEDVTTEYNARREIERRATRDELTGLWNRSRTLDHLQTTFDDMMKLGKEGGAILFLDLDGFKSINDIYGHSAGDSLLRRVAEILLSSVRPCDHVGRMGGDEFLIFIPGMNSEDDVLPVAQRLVERLHESQEVDGWTLRIGTTIGVSFLDRKSPSMKEVVQNADMALYEHKKGNERNSISFFEARMREETNTKKSLEQDLRSSLERGGENLAVFYQPMFETGTRRVTGCEALIRWNHPHIPKMSPDKFIPIAEESSLIVDLGEWVLRTACLEAASWESKLRISVNLSAVQFVIGDIVDTVRRVLDETGLEASRLELEFTESVMARDKKRVSNQILALKDLGIRISLDDFGTGYSSLGYIKDFHFDKIKIDRSFVDHIEEKDMCIGIVKAVMEIARVGNLTVVAEGIEREEELAKIRDLGVQQGQGYLIGKPMPADMFRSKYGEQQPLLRVVG